MIPQGLWMIAALVSGPLQGGCESFMAPPSPRFCGVGTTFTNCWEATHSAWLSFSTCSWFY